MTLVNLFDTTLVRASSIQNYSDNLLHNYVLTSYWTPQRTDRLRSNSFIALEREEALVVLQLSNKQNRKILVFSIWINFLSI